MKILVLGPAKSGKTVISNFLAGISKAPKQTTYHPTVGVRCDFCCVDVRVCVCICELKERKKEVKVCIMSCFLLCERITALW